MSPWSGRIARAALAVLLWSLTAHPAAADGPSPTSGWTAGPAGARPGEAGRPYVYLEGAPGAVLQDGISVTNPGPAPLTVRLRSTGAYEQSAQAGSWLRLASTTVTVPARTRADVPFAVTVPSAASPRDHSATVVAASGGREVVVRLRLRISGPALAALSVEDVGVSGRTIHYALVNRGNTPVVPRLAVEADGVFGALLRRTERTLALTVAPGQRVELTEPWRDAPALDSVTVRLRVTAPGGARASASASAVYASLNPVAGGALLLALATAAAGAHRLRRTPRRRPGRTAGPRRRAVDDRHMVRTGAET